MPLVRGRVEAHVGSLLELQPVYGWGWVPHFPWTHLRRQLPPRFRLRLNELFEFRGELNGGLGVLEADSGPLSGWICFELREEGWFDFQRDVGRYNLAIRHDRPIPRADVVSVWDDRDLFGFGLVGSPGFTVPW